MQAFGLSLIKGRLGSNQDRCEIQTPPEPKCARGPVFGAPRTTKTSNVAAAAIEAARPGSRPGPIRIDAHKEPHKELSHADNNEVFAGNALGPSISPGDGRR